jgi:hypothetical protein
MGVKSHPTKKKVCGKKPLGIRELKNSTLRWYGPVEWLK